MPAESRPLGVVLTAGSGTRLRPLTPDIPKALVPLLNRPLLTYSLELCRSMGLDEVAVVVGGEHAGTDEAARRLAPAGMRVSIAEQAEPRGPGDAVASVGDALAGRPVVVLAVDTVIHGSLAGQLEAFQRSGAVAGLVLHPTDRPQAMGIAVLEGDRIVSLDEKPEHPRSDLAVVGVWMLAPEAVERVRYHPLINAKGESDLTGTIAALVAEGRDVRGWRLEGEWLDGGELGALLHTQSRLLTDLEPTEVKATESELTGVVSAGKGTHVLGSRIAGPVLLGDAVTVEDCELGPDVVVGDGARLRSVRLRHAMVAPGARLEHADHEGVVVTPSGEVGKPE